MMMQPIKSKCLMLCVIQSEAACQSMLSRLESEASCG